MISIPLELPRDLRVKLKTTYCCIVDDVRFEPGVVPLFAVRMPKEFFGAPIVCPSFDDFYSIFKYLYRLYVDQMRDVPEFCPDVYFIGIYDRDNGTVISCNTDDYELPACVVTWNEVLAFFEEGEV